MLPADGHLPVTVTPDGVEGGDITMDAGLSSRFLTAIRLAIAWYAVTAPVRGRLV
ncbi:hypothetical protein ACFZBU_45315 [Embleya sp. NPDC008237]|uniref:hypothetical protein n=1 Tax=Embleya sp. NPDC008237 TaxID=3363978 RepID=UPI0036E60AEA